MDMFHCSSIKISFMSSTLRAIMLKNGHKIVECAKRLVIPVMFPSCRTVSVSKDMAKIPWKMWNSLESALPNFSG